MLSAMILGCKVWEEQAVWLVDFAEVFPAMKQSDLVQMEKRMLQILDYDVSLAAKEYAKTYFDLRAESKIVEQNMQSVRPLSKEDEEKLEVSLGFFLFL